MFSAKHDLNGQREMRLAGDKGKAISRGVNCTDKLRFAERAAATARPTVLLCWRISKARSVVTMTVTPKGKPSTAASVNVINKEWAGLA